MEILALPGPEARVELLDPARRQQVDSELAAQANEQATIEFHKYLTFALADGVLTVEEEKSLHRFGGEHGLSVEQISSYIEAELKDSGGHRVTAAAPRQDEAPRPLRRRQKSLDPKEDFMRMLRLSGLDTDGMADDTRDAFVNMAENLGIDAGEAEDLVDVYLEEADKLTDPGAPEPPRVAVVQQPIKAATNGQATPVAAPAVVLNPDADRQRFANFVNSFGSQMLFIPSAEFVMGSEAPDAGPNERPLTKSNPQRILHDRAFIWSPTPNHEQVRSPPGPQARARRWRSSSGRLRQQPGGNQILPVVVRSGAEKISAPD